MAGLARVVDMPGRTMPGSVTIGARVRRSRRSGPLRLFYLVLAAAAVAILVWSDLDDTAYVGDSPDSTAACLEGINKLYGTEILVSGETARRLGDSVALRPVDRGAPGRTRGRWRPQRGR